MTGTIFRHLFPIDGPALIDGRHLSFLFGLVVPVQRSVRHHHEVKVKFSDYVLTLDLNFPATFQLPPAHTRRGKPLRFVDAGNKCGTHPVTLKPFARERIVNWPQRDIVMATDGEIVTLWPFWDQVNRGWFVYPEPQGVGGTSVGNFPPRHPVQGTTWWNTKTGQLYIWTGREWVAASCCDGGIVISDEPPRQPLTGWLWFDSANNTLKVWDGHHWVIASEGGGGVAVVGPKPPVNPVIGQLHWSSDDAQLYVWSGKEWVAASCCDGAISIGSHPPYQPLTGWLWFDSSNNELKVWDGKNWIIASEGGGGGAVVGLQPPDSPFLGQLHWSPGDGQLYVWSGKEWAAASCCDGAIAIGSHPPDQPLTGWLWFDSSSNELKVWNGASWLAVSSSTSGASVHVGATPPSIHVTGDLWWDTVSGNLFVWSGTGWVITIASSGGGGSTADVVICSVGVAPPLTPKQGDLWWDTVSGDLFVWTGTGWVAAMASSGGGAVDVVICSVGVAPPLAPKQGDLWWDTTSGDLFVWSGTGWVAAMATSGGGSASIPVFSDIVNGLVPMTGTAPATDVLHADGTWQSLPNVFTSTVNGLVPAPGISIPPTYVLQANATWGVPTGGLTFVGIVPNVGALPATGSDGQLFLVQTNDHLYVWVSTPTPGWVDTGQSLGTTTSISVGSTVLSGGVDGSILFDNNGVLGQLTPTQLTQQISLYTTSANGIVPMTGIAAPTNVLMANGTWSPIPTDDGTF